MGLPHGIIMHFECTSNYVTGPIFGSCQHRYRL